MRDEPRGESLLLCAEALLRDEILAALPANKRQAGLMIAKAIAIAGRQMRNGDHHEREELASVDTLIPPLYAPQGHWRERLHAANRRLSLMIRQGHADQGGPRDEVFRHLLDTAQHKLGESNPGYLQQAIHLR